MDEHCTKRVCKSKVLRNGEAKSKIDIKEASKYLTICNNFNLPHFVFFRNNGIYFEIHV